MTHFFKHKLIFLLLLAANTNAATLPEPPITIVVRTPSAVNGIDLNRPANDPGKCDEQRRLDDRGLSEIRQLKNELSVFRNVQKILSSEYCRSIETASQVFPSRQAISTPILNDACFANADANQSNLKDTRALIVNSNENQVLFMHNCNIRMLFYQSIINQCGGTGRLESGQWMVVKPDSNQLTVVKCPE